ncbi:CinA family protein [Verrucomicrobiota bacterium]
MMKVEEEVGRLLGEKGLTLAVAESCTGGLVGHQITSASGSSAYFLGGIIAYSNEVKIRELNVDAEAIDRHGAVSQEVAMQMAAGIKAKFGSDIGLGLTGIAGPEGGSRDKPVGLVYMVLADGKKYVKQCCRFDGDRSHVKAISSQTALEMIREYVVDL